MLNEIREELRKYATPENASALQRFFKTGKGEYGEGDLFIGVKVPAIRKAASRFSTLPASGIKELVKSPYHEERLLALIILTKQFGKADEAGRGRIVNIYLKNRKHINNWDLVDLSAPYILGPYLFDKDKDILYEYARNGNLWEKRIAVLTTFYFIRKGESGTALDIITILLGDKRDLIHKACGWMLREIGNRNIEAEEEFLKQHYRSMPRTMLRYAIEKFPENKRLNYLKGLI